jgi:guanylate kinase
MSDLGNLYVISAPSGTGKTTLVKALVDSIPGITVSTSHTTRPKRPAETHGVNYYFVEESEFQRMVSNHEFLEYATVFDHHYGTSRRWVEETLAMGQDVILEIEWQGCLQIQKIFPNCISIYILPPSVNDLFNRLTNRNQDSKEIIKQRLQDVRETMHHIGEYNYVVINDDFSTALADLAVVVQSGRLLQTRQMIKNAKLLSQLENAKLDAF